MSKKKVSRKTPLKPTEQKITASKQTSSSTKVTKQVVNTQETDFLFKKQNFIYIFGGVGLMIIGYFLMAGGSMPSNDVWDSNIIYSTRRTLIAPIIILAGLGLQIYAIFKK